MSSRRWQAWTVLLALAVRAMIAPGFMVAPAAADGFATIVVCTPEGMRLMAVGPDGQPRTAPGDADSSGAADGGRTCPFGSAPIAVTAGPARIEVPRDVIAVRHNERPTTALIAYRVRFRLARGPPLGVV